MNKRLSIVKNCEICQKEFSPRPFKPGRFCSIPCKKKWIIPRQKLFCIICNKEMHYYPSSVRILCSLQCKAKWQLHENKGPLALYSKLTESEKIEKLKKLFWPKVIKSEGCWEWTAQKDKNGYGRMTWNHKSGFGAHRASWIIHNGEIPKGMVVMHSCDSPPCTNPLHLLLGTVADNNLDKAKKGRNNVLKSTNHPSSKLTKEDVLEIRRLLKIKIPQHKIAEQFNIEQQGISRINSGKSYKDII